MTLGSNENAGQPAAVRKMDARPMLVIGLGTTGARVCNQVLERLRWNFNSPDAVSWLRMIILETAKPPAEYFVSQYARIVHMRIEHVNYLPLWQNPQAYSDRLDLPRWQVPEVSGAADCIEDGAKNIRHLGRLAFFYPDNYAEIVSLVREAVNELAQIKSAEATKRFGDCIGETVAIEFATKVHVYVVGTLCGGTSSGCFIDLGYLLRHFENVGVPILATTGIFLLPSTGHSSRRELANAVAGLLELNHYSSDRSRYACQYPDQPGAPTVFPAGMRPYNHLYLVQARPGTSKVRYAQLITATADYIYADVMGSSASTRDARRTNIAEFFTRPDFYGATQKYYTFGISVIDYPYAKVLKACQLRLAAKGLEGLSGGGLTDTARNRAAKDLPLINRSQMEEELLRTTSGSLRTVLHDVVDSSYQAALESNDTMDLLMAQIVDAFDGGAQAESHPRLGRRIVPETLDGNAQKAERKFMGNIDMAIREYLVQGVRSAQDFVSQVRIELSEQQKKIAEVSGELAVEHQRQAKLACERAEDCRSDWALALNVATKPAVQRYVMTFIYQTKQFIDARITLAAAPIIASIYGNVDQWLRQVETRLTNYAHQLREYHTKMQRLLVETQATTVGEDPWSRSTTGKELYDEGTVDREYLACLQHEAHTRNLGADMGAVEARLGSETVQPYLEQAMKWILQSPTEPSPYDILSPKEPTETTLLEIAAHARPHFGLLSRKSVLDHLFNEADPHAVIKEVSENSRILLEWSASAPQYDMSNEEKKAYGFVFFNDRDPSAATFVSHLQQPDIKAPDIMSWSDNYQILFLQERGAFSLGTLPMLANENTSWFQAYKAEGPLKLRSRADVDEWIGWMEVDEQDRRAARNVFLVGIALGLIEPAGHGEFRYSYEPLQPTDPGKVTFTTDLYEVVNKIRSKKLLTQLQRDITNWRNNNTDAEFVSRVTEFVKTDDAAYFKEGPRALSTEVIWVYLEDYILSDDGLRRAYQSTTWGKQMVEIWEQLRGKEDNNQDPRWYYCPHCNQKLGRHVEDLYVLSKGKFVAICRACNKTLLQ